MYRKPRDSMLPILVSQDGRRIAKCLIHEADITQRSYTQLSAEQLRLSCTKGRESTDPLIRDSMVGTARDGDPGRVPSGFRTKRVR